MSQSCEYPVRRPGAERGIEEVFIGALNQRCRSLLLVYQLHKRLVIACFHPREGQRLSIRYDHVLESVADLAL